VIGYRLLPPAEEEMIEAALSYDLAKAGLGDLFLDDIQHAIDTVREYPELGESVAYGFRRILLRRFPFSVIYLVESEEIAVVAVAHQRRHPDYWKGRA
jgi:plasmid stabilization system protein ParE